MLFEFWMFRIVYLLSAVKNVACGRARWQSDKVVSLSPSNTCHYSNNTCHYSNNTCHYSNNTCHYSNNTCHYGNSLLNEPPALQLHENTYRFQFERAACCHDNHKHHTSHRDKTTRTKNILKWHILTILLSYMKEAAFNWLCEH